jgi:Gpi18-like mannosyltransferase
MGWAALLAALLFAVHPIHTEAVDWISGIMEPLYTLLGLLSFYFFLDLVKRRSRAALLLSALLFLLALFSKETAVLLLPLFLFWDLAQAEELSIKKIRYGDYLPYVLAVAFYLAMRTHALDRFIPLDMHPELTTYDCVINIFPLFVQHLWKLVWPFLSSCSISGSWCGQWI